MDFKNYIKKSRKKLGLTQAQFAEQIGGASWITVWRWENGKAEPLNYSKNNVIQKVQELLNGK